MIRYVLLALSIVALPATDAAAQTTYYLGPNGAGDGTSPETPFGSLEDAYTALDTPGDTLILLDGVYETSGRDGRLVIDDKSGTEDAPIVIQAQNERQAWLKGDGDLPALDILDSEWIVVNGLRISADDFPDDPRNGSPLRLGSSEHITLYRLLVHHTNRYDNASGYYLARSQDVLVEESELYYFHRNGFSAFQSEDVTIRRCYANSRDYQQGVPGGPDTDDRGGDTAFRSYYANDFLAENSISENKNHGFSGASGRNTVTGDTSGQHLTFLGNISIDDERAGNTGSRDRSDLDDGGLQPMRDVLYRNHLGIGYLEIGLVTRAMGDLTMENVTLIDGQDEVFGANLEPQRNWPACEEFDDGCTFRLRNWLAAYNAGPVLEDVPTGDESVDFLASHSNFYLSGSIGLSEDISDNEGQIQQSMQQQPTGMSTLGCLVFVPDTSNMAGAGADTDGDGNPDDIGANILYRYEDGELTDEELWDPQTGEFPHGAVIDSLNGVADSSAFDVHERLNVNTNGCRLPYATSTAIGETSEVPDALRLHQNYPNPFNPSTQISFDLPQASAVKLTVYDVLGREVATLVDGQRMTAGEHQIRFEAEGLPSGMYLYRLETNGQTRTQKMMLVQ